MIIVTGSSGFIGSKVTLTLIQNGYNVIGIDRLPSAFSSDQDNYIHYQGDLCDINFLKNLPLSYGNIEAVFHLAADIKVAESEMDPYQYYNNNIMSTLNILELMKDKGVRKIFFTSTAAVYSTEDSSKTCFSEEDPRKSHSVYGNTKIVCEDIITDYIRVYGIKAVIFRFFNVGGCVNKTEQPTHLIPVIISRYLQDMPVIINGTDHPTVDGTCVRDYIHVNDIAKAMIEVYTADLNSNLNIFNVGTTNGRSVKEIIEKTRELIEIHYPDSHKSLEVIEGSRRPGDPSTAISKTDKIYNAVGWKPTNTLEDMIKDTLDAYMIK